MQNSMFGKSTSPSPGMSHKMMTHQLGGLDPTLNQMSQPFASNGIQLLQQKTDSVTIDLLHGLCVTII